VGGVIYIYIYIYIYIHIHIHTYTQTHTDTHRDTHNVTDTHNVSNLRILSHSIPHLPIQSIPLWEEKQYKKKKETAVWGVGAGGGAVWGVGAGGGAAWGVTRGGAASPTCRRALNNRWTPSTTAGRPQQPLDALNNRWTLSTTAGRPQQPLDAPRALRPFAPPFAPSPRPSPRRRAPPPHAPPHARATTTPLRHDSPHAPHCPGTTLALRGAPTRVRKGAGRRRRGIIGE
jgi:hypothetical protein